jgi:hypothetical protein
VIGPVEIGNVVGEAVGAGMVISVSLVKATANAFLATFPIFRSKIVFT